MDLVATLCRRRHYSPRTEESYRYWIRQYIYFHDKCHPGALGAQEVEAFLNHLATVRQVSASTQTQALNALVFLYEAVLEKPLGRMAGLKRVQKHHRVPVVLTRDEVRTVLAHMSGTPRLMAELIYGAGLRVQECVTLRVKDVDLAAGSLSVRCGKGSKDRTTVLPGRLREPLQQHLLRVTAETFQNQASGGSARLEGLAHPLGAIRAAGKRAATPLRSGRARQPCLIPA
jgi:site-specific recombinase XerD